MRTYSARFAGTPARARDGVLLVAAGLALATVLALVPLEAYGQTTYPAAANPLYFNTAGGLVDPGLIVGFNPQPDPPGDVYNPNMTNPFDPSITQLPGYGFYTINFGLLGGPGDLYTFILPQGGPNSDGQYTFFEQGDGRVYQVSMTIGGLLGSFVTFNPQPDPPDILGIGFAASPPTDGLARTGPTLSWQVDEGYFGDNGQFVSDGALSFARVPEPASLALVSAGLLGLLGLRRRFT